jgi:predicted dehydrogenase
MTDVAVIGCGFMGRNHAHAINDHPTLRLTSAVDLDRETADTVASKYNAASYTDFEQAVAEVDAVVVATPETVHTEQAQTVIDYDRHLLLEKPLTVDTDEAWSLADRADERDAVSGVSFILRYDPSYAGLHEAVTSDKIGEPVSVQAKRGITRSESQRIGGRGHPLYYMNLHDIDAMRWITGCDVTQVSAIERRGELADIDVPDAMHATLTFENGAVGTLVGHGILPDDTPGGISAEFELVGTAGTAAVDTPGSTLTVHDTDGYDRPDVRHWPVRNGRMGGAVRQQIDYFAAAVSGNGKLLASIHDGAHAQAIADAIHEAAIVGKPQSVPDSD